MYDVSSWGERKERNEAENLGYILKNIKKVGQ